MYAAPDQNARYLPKGVYKSKLTWALRDIDTLGLVLLPEMWKEFREIFDFVLISRIFSKL